MKLKEKFLVLMQKAFEICSYVQNFFKYENEYYDKIMYGFQNSLVPK